MKALLALLILTLAGCATAPAPTSADPAIYRPARGINYPAPR